MNQRLASLDTERLSLQREIGAYERRIALTQCDVRDLPKLQAAAPLRAPDEVWKSREVSGLQGCWDLESLFVTKNRTTGVTSRYESWRMCFDTQGVGTEEMRADNGSVCRGQVRGAFDAAGDLVIDQPGNLRCSDGGFLYQMQSRCRLDASGAANCDVTQKEPGATANVEFRRTLEGN